MVASVKSKITWHYESLPKPTKKALDFFSEAVWLKKSEWYLAGGTALALRVGNRKSYDLDFFTQQRFFNKNNLLSHFIGNTGWITEIQENNTVHGQLFGTKVSFIANPFFTPKQKMERHGSVRVLQPADIAVMKLIAISQRGKKRDFFDLYWCANNLEPLAETIKRLPDQYPTVAHDYHHILKSLVYFDDAESDPDPMIFFTASWTVVKNFFKREVPILARKLIRLD